MNDRDVPQPIEIEVIPNSMVDDPVASGSTDDDLQTPGRGPLLAAVTVVGAVTLCLGVLIGYSAGSDRAATTEVTTPRTTDAPVATTLPGVPLPAPTTTRPARTTTTTTLAPTVVEPVGVDDRLAGVDLRLVGLEQHQGHVELVELDLAERTLTRTDLGRRFDTEAMLAGDDWLMLMDGAGTTRMLRDGQLVQTVRLGDPWAILWQEGTDRFWRPDPEGTSSWDGPSLFEQVDVDGEPTGVTVELPPGSWAERTDPRGGLVVQANGKYYSIDATGAVQVGSGQLIALSPDVAVLRDCDDRLRCGLFVADRVTGGVRELVPDPPRDGVQRIEALWNWGAVGTMSPRGEMCAVMLLSDQGPGLGLVDLVSGEIIEVGRAGWAVEVAWSPDDRFAFFVDQGFETGNGGDVLVYDRLSDEVFPVFTEERQWDRLAARPTTTTDDASDR